MVLFAGLVSVIFGVIGREGTRPRVTYGLKIFAEFLVIGYVLAWLLYWLP
jgi:hypothetical protein